MRRSAKISLVPAVLSMGLLAGVAVQNFGLPRASDAERYHERVLKAAKSVPMQIGPFIGHESKVPPAALRLLNPNIIISRVYEDSVQNSRVGFLFVHCRNARDLQGHYPPNCYPNQGLIQINAGLDECKLGDLRVPMKVYEFISRSSHGEETVTVYNFVITPDHKVLPDQTEVHRAAGSYTRRYHGAAQVLVEFRESQLYDVARLDEQGRADWRHEVVQTFINASRELIEAVRLGVKE